MGMKMMTMQNMPELIMRVHRRQKILIFCGCVNMRKCCYQNLKIIMKKKRLVLIDKIYAISFQIVMVNKLMIYLNILKMRMAMIQMMELLQQSDKEPGHMGEDGDVHKKKKAVRVGVSIADQLKDELAQFQTSSDDDDDDDVAVQKKKRKHSNKSAQKSTAAMFAAIDDFDTSSDNDGDVNGGGFFTSDKKTDIKDFGLSDDDSDDDFGLMDELNSKIKKQASAENEIDPTKLLPNKQKKAPKKKNNDPFGDSSDDNDENENDAETDLFSSNTKTAKKQSNDPFGDSSDDDDFGSAQNIKSQIDPTKLLPNKQQKKAVSNDMFGSSDDDEFESKPIASKQIKKNVQKTKTDMFDDSDDDDMFG